MIIKLNIFIIQNKICLQNLGSNSTHFSQSFKPRSKAANLV